MGPIYTQNYLYLFKLLLLNQNISQTAVGLLLGMCKKKKWLSVFANEQIFIQVHLKKKVTFKNPAYRRQDA